MATVVDNIFLKGFSGTVSQITFRQKGGKTIVSRKRRPGINATPAQLENQEKFNDANRYAKSAIKDLVIKAIYKSAATGGQSAYNVALSDAFKGPKIKLISIREGIVSIKADKLLILKMDVQVLDKDGVILEEGQAAVSGKYWKYAISVENGVKVIVTATNRPGKVISKEADITHCSG
jgi:hypothetical protein